MIIEIYSVNKRFKILEARVKELEKILSNEREGLGKHEQKKKLCDCTHTQACSVCAESKDIDWSIIENTK